MTGNSSSSAYATGAQMVTRYDVRTVGGLLADDGTQVASGSVAADANLAVLLKDASGMVEAKCLQGKRYQPSDLSGMSGVNANLLQRIVCGLTMWMLMDRRSMRTVGEPTPLPEWIKEYLDGLANGTEIFGFVEVQDAGLTEVVERQDTDPTNFNRVVERARRFFGDRSGPIV